MKERETRVLLTKTPITASFSLSPSSPVLPLYIFCSSYGIYALIFPLAPTTRHRPRLRTPIVVVVIIIIVVVVIIIIIITISL